MACCSDVETGDYHARAGGRSNHQVRTDTMKPRRAGHHGAKSTLVGKASVTTVGPNDNLFAALNLPEADEWLAKAKRQM